MRSFVPVIGHDVGYLPVSLPRWRAPCPSMRSPTPRGQGPTTPGPRTSAPGRAGCLVGQVT
jgi:hypothetical protein